MRPALFWLLPASLLLTACPPTVADDDDDDSAEVELPLEADRRVLHEWFSGSNCGPCAPAAERLEQVLAENPGAYTVIKYQLGSDPYVSREAIDRRMWYLPEDAETYSVPFSHCDGVHGFHPNELNDDQGYLASDLATWAAVPSPLLLDVAHTLDGQTVDASITVTPLSELPADLRLHAAIIEGTTTENIGSNGQTEFHWVFKKWLSPSDGLPLPAMARGEVQTQELSWTFQGSYDDSTSITSMVDHATAHTVEEFEDLVVIAWVQDHATTEVLQSGWDAP